MGEQARRYRLWLGFALGTAHGRVQSLLEAYEGDAAALFQDAKKGRLPGAGQRDLDANALLRKKADEGYIDECLRYMERKGVHAVLLEDGNYPALLRHIYRPPMCLYVKGRLPKEIPLPIAMIGSRRCSPYGEEAALFLAKGLAENGVCVVSGLAAGVDGLCAQGALEAADNPFPTVAVLGSGVDVVYPASNRALYERVVERGAVVSELLPGARPQAKFFPQRNRIISGMSRGVVVVEAAEKSGTSITVDFALEQGRDVFALPGRMTDENSRGTNRMIADGATPVTCAADILGAYGIASLAERPRGKPDGSGLPYEQALVFRLLEAGERSIDELCEMTGLSFPELNFTLTDMELSGIIKQSSGRLYGLQMK